MMPQTRKKLATPLRGSGRSWGGEIDRLNKQKEALKTDIGLLEAQRQETPPVGQK